ncbi:MAG: helix-turn-helix domain-containing protein [Clostridia bacterium]|nr:helix-turn-helix domain-containing protein [Clostridia bacterium]
MRVFSKHKFIENGILSAQRKWYSGVGSAHSHDFFEIEYILQGSGCCTVNGTPYPVKPGMLFFLSPADTHSLSAESTELYNVMFPCSFFDTDLLFSLFAPGTAVAVCLSASNRAVMESLLGETVGREPEYARHFLRCILLKLSTLIPHLNSRPDSHIQAAIVYILENFRSAITLQETAEHIGLTAAYLSTLFRQETGKNFKTYVDELRFDHAARLLRSTELPVSEICPAAGFNDYANFSRRFRQKYGCSPGDYRK